MSFRFEEPCGRIEAVVPEPWGLLAKRITWEDGRIVEAQATGGADVLAVPGFVDLHCHGGGGADVMDGGDAVHHIARTHAAHGTQAFLATTMTAPDDEIEHALSAVAAAMRNPRENEARILGVHLEGPFICPNQLGAQPNHTQPATVEKLQRWLKIAPIRVVTMAPEADPNGTVRDWLRAEGVRVQIGHTSADYSTAREWLEAGCGITHLFNAMGGFHHRGGGCVAAALAHGNFGEIIPDLLHCDEGSYRLARKSISNLYCVTDATAASGMPDGEYRLGSQTVVRSGGAVRLPCGALAGSCLTMDRAFANLVALGQPVHEAVRMTSSTALNYMGTRSIPGFRFGDPASFVVTDLNGGLVSSIINGRVV